LLEPLGQIAAAVASLNEDIQDTLLALNSDLMLEFLDLYAIAKANNRDGRYDTFIQPIKNGRFFRPPRPAIPRPTTLNPRRRKSDKYSHLHHTPSQKPGDSSPKDCANRQP